MINVKLGKSLQELQMYVFSKLEDNCLRYLIVNTIYFFLYALSSIKYFNYIYQSNCTVCNIIMLEICIRIILIR